MILHTVNKSPFQQTTLSSCLRLIVPGDVLLLIEDGVYGATAGHSQEAVVNKLAELNIRVYALEGDILARGLTSHLLSTVSLATFDEFVALSVIADNVHSWY